MAPSTVTATPIAQPASRLFCIPQEIRSAIFEALFRNTRLSYGRSYLNDDLEYKAIKPGVNSLAILRTCRQVHQQIGLSWTRFVLFSFEDVLTMTDKLSSLPFRMRALIKHMRICQQGAYNGDHPYHAPPLYERINRVHGLRLDLLVVLGKGQRDEENYRTLDGLIKHGVRWKELLFIPHQSGSLSFMGPWPLAEDIRDPQPYSWDQELKNRDGNTASVVISRSTVPEYRRFAPGDAPRFYIRSVDVKHWKDMVAFEQKWPEDFDACMNYGYDEDREILGYDERHKDMLVVVKRGRRTRFHGLLEMFPQAPEKARGPSHPDYWVDKTVAETPAVYEETDDNYSNAYDYVWRPRMTWFYYHFRCQYS
ncbi:hypothetical protein B0T22DRAFT_521635 [Podospora appendiculata]|uniref:F-box domain-containing protein n=1 Tax=Podospora appendiculata TaxID=314037 RepID=A0AAE0X0U5_9PEZI|nr:hypothetical protein B0T22DRAFT_521635 [Podospora appendiculata]